MSKNNKLKLKLIDYFNPIGNKGEALTAYAVSLFDQAYASAKRKSKTERMSVFGADEIGSQLVWLVVSELSGLDLLDQEKFIRLYNSIYQWAPARKVGTNDDQFAYIEYKCGVIQQELVGYLDNLREQQQYKQACANYLVYLEDLIRKLLDSAVLEKEQKLLFSAKLFAVEEVVEKKDETAEGPFQFFRAKWREHKAKKQPTQPLPPALKPEGYAALLQVPGLNDLIEKYEAVKQLKRSLSNLDKIPYERIKSFYHLLEEKKTVLSKRRDSGFITFAKALGVVGASIFGLGIGGVYAYHYFFGERATRGGQLLLGFNEIKEESAKLVDSLQRRQV